MVAVLLATSRADAESASSDYFYTDEAATSMHPQITSSGSMLLLSSFRQTLKENKAAGVLVVKGFSGSTLASFSDSAYPSAASFPHESKMAMASVKADSSLYFNADTSNVEATSLRCAAVLSDAENHDRRSAENARVGCSANRFASHEK